MTGLRLWSNGVPLDDLGVVGDSDLQIATVYGDSGCGLDTLSWSMSLPRGFAHPAIEQGAVIEVRRGLGVVAVAINDEPDPEAWKFTAKGLLHRAGDFIAVNTAGTPTNNLADALTAAVANGLEWKLPATLPVGLVALDSPDQVVTLSELLARYCAANSKRWGITGSGWFQLYTDPASPRWVLSPDAPSLPSARGQVSRLRVRYATSADSEGNIATLGVVTVGASATAKGVVESFADITNDGVLTAPQATTIAQGMLAEQAPQERFTAGVTAGPGQVSSFGDVPMDGALWMVALNVGEGAVICSQGWRSPDVGTNGMSFDWLAGAAVWSRSSGLTLTPISMAATTLGDNMAEIRAGLGTAQTTADNALAVGSPDYLQSLITEDSDTTSGAMPSSAQIGDLWLDNPDAYICVTPYATGGTIANWAKVTDPRTLAMMRTHAIAFLAADAAATDATTALTAANGKNKITGATRTPTSSDPGVEGDTWEYFVGGNISAVYTYTSGVWTIRKIRDEVIDTLTVGKVVGLDAAFLNANIDYLTSVSISSSILTSSTITTAQDGSNYWYIGNNYSGDGGVIENRAPSGAKASLTYQPFASSSSFYLANNDPTYGLAEIMINSGSSGSEIVLYAQKASVTALSSSSTVHADSDVTAGGAIYSDYLINNTATAASNVYADSNGGLHRTSGSSRGVKYDIEPAEIDADIDALEQCGVWAYHYRTDPEARAVIGFIVEDMLEQGLRRYVDFDENEQPLQPAWNQISALYAAAHQRNAKRITALETDQQAMLTRLAALEAS